MVMKIDLFLKIVGITGTTERENGFQITSNKKITTLQVKQWEKEKKQIAILIIAFLFY